MRHRLSFTTFVRGVLAAELLCSGRAGAEPVAVAALPLAAVTRPRLRAFAAQRPAFGRIANISHAHRARAE